MADSVLARMAVQIQGNTAQFNRSMTDASKSMDRFGKQAKQSEGLASSFGKQLLALGAGIGLTSIAKQIFDVTAEFQKLGAVLNNTLGSQSLAAAALSDIKTFAAQTPFGVQELTASFVKLANQGFKPTIDQLRNLGDIAASQGKSFDQLTEAIIDAQTGEFERLKEFGIRASKEGDKVTFTFKGVKQQVDFTNESIRGYILSLGDAAGVSGSMAAISQTLGGQVSNLGDSFDNLFNGLGSASTGILSYVLTQLSTAVNFVAEIVNDANALRDPFAERRSQNVSKEFEEFKKLSKSGQTQAINAIVQEIQEWRSNLDQLTQAFAVNEEAGLNSQQKLEKAAKILNLSVEDTFELFKKQNVELEITKSNVREVEELFKLFTSEYNKNTQAAIANTAAIKANNAAKKEQKQPLVPNLPSVGGGLEGVLDSLQSGSAEQIQKLIDNLRSIPAVVGEVSEEIKRIDIGGTISSGIADIANAFGEAAVGGEDFGKQFIKALARFAQQFGALLIATGLGQIALNSGNPALMIAGGAALIAAGAAINALMSKKPSLSGGGSSSGGGFVNTRPNVDPNVQGNLQLSTSVSGTDLNLVIGNSNNRDNYTKPQWR
jgi:phage tail tape-measure protein